MIYSKFVRQRGLSRIYSKFKSNCCSKALHYSASIRNEPNSTKYNYVVFSLTSLGLLYMGSQYRLTNDSTNFNKTKINPSELEKHNKKYDCWVVIEDQVYDLTEFATIHPGGEEVILANAGKDVTNIFKPLHPKDVIEKFLPKEKRLGELSEPMPKHLVCPKYTPGESLEDIARKERLKATLPPLESISNLYEFEHLASKILSNQAWAYYSSAADDEITYRENHSAYHRIFFKPKVLVDVSKTDTSTNILGQKMDVPFYVTATALAKLGNANEGEMDITRGCGQGLVKVPQMVSTLSSCTVDEIINAKVVDDQVLWFQLYINSDRKITESLVKHVEELGFKAIFVTVDAPTFGNREKDTKIKFSHKQNESANIIRSSSPSNDSTVYKGASNALSSFIDPSITWKDIQILRKLTKLPIFIKGVQRVEDVVKAAEIGCQGVVISNHGGRQLDFTRAPIEILAESKPALKAKNLDKNFDLFVDGGVRRGTDILKALCLGAKGVGLGRPFIYANSCYGKDGVQRAIELLNDELILSMKLLGVTTIDELNESFLDLTSINNHGVLVPEDSLATNVYHKATLPILKEN